MRLRLLRALGAVALVGCSACALLVGVDFDRAHAREEDAGFVEGDAPGASDDGRAPEGEDAGDGAAARPTPRAVAASDSHTCAILEDGSVACWGDGTRGQLGVDAGDVSALPVVVAGVEGASALSVGLGYSCALVDGGARCWGRLDEQSCAGSTTFDVRKIAIPGATRLAAGRSHACFRMASGGIRCLGDDGFGQLGDGTSGVCSGGPARDVVGVPPSSGAIAVGNGFSCAVTDDAGVMCWGRNDDGQLGTGATGALENPVPVRVANLPPTADLVAGSGHTCARLVAGDVACWGWSPAGALGQGADADVASGSVVPVGGLPSAVSALAAGSAHTCALTSAPSPSCWGANFDGQLGIGTFDVEKTSTPRAVVGLLEAPRVIAAGGQHTCAIVPGGVVCWGKNDRGQLGDGTTTSSPSPVRVKGL